MMIISPKKNRNARVGRDSKPYHHGSLRQALLDAALDIIAEGGLSALTLRQAASRAGVSHAAPKRHFASVTDLYCALAEDGYRKLRAYLLERVTKRPRATLSQAMAILGVAYVEFATAHPALFRAMFHSATADRSTPHPVEAAAGETFDVLVSAIERGQEEGEIRKGSARDLALGAWSLVHGLAVLAVDRQLANRGFSSDDPVKLARELVQQLYLGLRP
jgi:AcrR family transcriptional regulator